MKKRELANLGVPPGKSMQEAMRAAAAAAKSGMKKGRIRSTLTALIASPEDHADDPIFGGLAASVVKVQEARARYEPRSEPAPYQQWGTDLEEQAVRQMDNACQLPVAVVGALMPDAHLGYGLPIGGVLAVRNAVIPYAVGVDIACRMKMTVLDLPLSALEGDAERLRTALSAETRFGIGAAFRRRRSHAVMDEDWSFSPVTAEMKDRAWSQLGTSGSGNHFAEFGELTLEQDNLGLKAGSYLALLSHSGSRGVGARVADYYSKVAMNNRPELPREQRHLAWLDLDTEAGQEYWMAMELMGRYAAANHELIHRHIAEHLGVAVLLDLENHHNFAWRETYQDREVIVHRKGATPAHQGVLGIIPGSMASPAYIVRGKGKIESLCSAAHGAGRRMSRKAAKKQFKWKDLQYLLKQRGVTLLSAGLDEAPMAYKDIDTVMAAQADLVEPVACFHPRLVKMAPAGERPED